MALESGWIMPETSAQEKFLRVCRGEIRPSTEFERIWVRYTNTVEEERKERLGRAVEDSEREAAIINLQQVLGALEGDLTENDLLMYEQLHDLENEEDEVDRLRAEQYREK